MHNGAFVIHDIEKIMDDIVNNRVHVHELAPEQLEAVMDYIRDVFTDMLGGENEDFAEGMLEVLDTVHNVIENRAVGEAIDWTPDIQASIERGNTYFEMGNYILQ